MWDSNCPGMQVYCTLHSEHMGSPFREVQGQVEMMMGEWHNCQVTDQVEPEDGSMWVCPNLVVESMANNKGEGETRSRKMHAPKGLLTNCMPGKSHVSFGTSLRQRLDNVC